MSAPRRPELLAPAGDADALRAAVAAGADAVYLGLTAWSARARAANFEASALQEALAYLHRHGRKGYVAINTLVFDAELDEVEEAVRLCAAAGADAVIVQDLGVARLARAIAPDMPIHASTQMTCTDAAAVELARELGASRVILARELSLEDIARIGEGTDVELEVFVHGALCIAYSGQCLTSEAIGGRSANRGACAQACRLPYQLVVDGDKRDGGERAYLLSPQDLEASELVGRLSELGVAGLKIEGRMKTAPYVAATTTLYRRTLDALDGGPPTDEATRLLALQSYTRGSGHGFLAGVDHQRLVEGRGCDHRGTELGICGGVRRDKGRSWIGVHASAPIRRGDGVLVEGGFASEGEVGGRVWALRVGRREVDRVDRGQDAEMWLGPDVDGSDARADRRVWKTGDPAATKELLASVATGPRRIQLDLRVRGRVGEPPEIVGTTGDGLRARVVGEAPVDEARSAPTSVEMLRDKLGRLGDTPFELGAIEADLDGRALLPPGALNRLRRALVAELLGARERRWACNPVGAAEILGRATPPAQRQPAPAGLFVLCRTLEQARAAHRAGADGVWLDFLSLDGLGEAVRALRDERLGFLGLAPPRIRKPGEESIDRHLASLEPDGLLVRGLGALREATGVSDGRLRVGDFSLNATNCLTAAELLGRGLGAFTPSFDLDASQLMALLRTPFGPWAELVIHHPVPLFHMEHCVIAAELSTGSSYRDCGRPCDHHRVSLRDREGMDHPVEADVGCRNTVFHAAPQSAASLVPGAREAGVKRYRVELVREGADEVSRVVTAYRQLIQSQKSPAEVWSELRVEGEYGVVRGSLRVLVP